MKMTKFDPVEMVTVIGLIGLGGVALWLKQPELAVAIGGGLVGYLTKSNNGN